MYPVTSEANPYNVPLTDLTQADSNLQVKSDTFVKMRKELCYVRTP